MFVSISRIMSEMDVKQRLTLVLNKINEACTRRPPEFQYNQPILVAVTKIKPVELIVEAYEAGQRHFGENYVQELEEKATNPIILEKCKDIKWHFIGHLQTNKINKILGLKNLYLIETVDTQKLAMNLNKNWLKFYPTADETGQKLNVMVQINTSGEDEKNGVQPGDETLNLCKFIMNECKYLKLIGLMTIGKIGHNPNDGLNPDFLSLRKCRDQVCKDLGLDWKQMDISMGMSNDYEQAIELGSNYVRVGEAIFGPRPKKTTTN